MVIRPSVLCAIDFSPASRGALRYAAALAEHFYARLSVITVDDPFLSDASGAVLGHGWLELDTRQALERFVEEAFAAHEPRMAEIHLIVAVGEPAAQILRAVHDTAADAVVMSTHGLRGVGKLMFGSTTERVLRATQVPVVVTPGADPGPDSLENWKATVKCVVAPVDLSAYSPRQITVTRSLAEAIGTRVVLAHVLEPIRARPASAHIAAPAEANRDADAYHRLEELIADLPSRLKPTIAIGHGDPAIEIARIAKEHAAGAIVMALHTAPGMGRQMGTVTYRLLCQTSTLVIAWPPSLGAAGVLATGTTARAEGHPTHGR